jgi:hypothetical protein
MYAGPPPPPPLPPAWHCTFPDGVIPGYPVADVVPEAMRLLYRARGPRIVGVSARAGRAMPAADTASAITASPVIQDADQRLLGIPSLLRHDVADRDDQRIRHLIAHPLGHGKSPLV